METRDRARSQWLSWALAAALAAAPAAALAEGKYGPGTSDKEIKIGQTIAYSGPASAYGQLGKVQTAYFDWLNKTKGGINGRKITFISKDDGYQPPKAVENVRSLVEGDDVALIFGVLGTPINMSIRTYLNGKKVPQLFIAAGSSAFNDPKKFPWTMGWQPNLHDEAKFYAKHVLSANPNAKIAVLYQNDDFGKDLLNGLRDGLGDRADKMIVSTQSFQAADPTVDSPLVILHNSGADTLFLFTYSKQGAQAISKIADLNWKPATYLHLGAASVGATLKPAGLDKSTGVMTAGFMKDVTDPKWADDKDVKEWLAWTKENMPGADINDSLNPAGYAYAQTIEQVLRQAGDDLTRESIMKQAANLKNFRVGLLLPESRINTTPENYAVVTYMKLQRFNGKSWDFVD
ncbi:ABC transporter substrate-binding protein [Chelatococcus reniformis]|uniref:Branched-chain amino acid ABC transporter substrate-binding protein n=1 Tax=Chelatococcus reniformis TaxID=1494448 RepID=A0A916UWK5_9HYPH|nr:ABC transporter substrate-binding protein [Chelatococcus reniformis]GGC92021.1 branched-chain amino acid ABC transporter substrate-binding protein [Chelatococcus reniformis]